MISAQSCGLPAIAQSANSRCPPRPKSTVVPSCILKALYIPAFLAAISRASVMAVSLSLAMAMERWTPIRPAGSLPSSSRASLYWRVRTLMSFHDGCGPSITRSARAAARRTAPRLCAAIQMGGCGCCTGVRPSFAPCTCQCLPSWLTSSPLHSSFISSMDSSNRLTRSLRLVPKAESSATR